MQYSPEWNVVSRRYNVLTTFLTLLHRDLCRQNYITPNEKIFLQKSFSLKKKRSNSLIAVLVYRLSTRRVRCWRSPPEPSSLSLRVSGRPGTLGGRVPIQAVFAVGLDVHSLAARYHGSKLRGRPFMCSRIYLENMYIIYNARLQRPSAGCGVHRARCLLSFATGLIIIPRTSSSCSSVFPPQGGDEDTFMCSAWFVTDDAFNEDA